MTWLAVLAWIVLAIAVLVAALLAGAAIFTVRTVRKIEAALPPQGRFVEVAGNRLHYVDRGSGPVLLMIHGLGGQLGNFTYGLVDRLSDRFRVIALDRPGSGYSTRAAGASPAIGAQADVIAAFIEALGLGRPLVVGHSLGGAISLALALRHPDRVAGLALISPLTHAQQEVPEAFEGLVVPAALRGLIARTIAVPLGIRMRDKVLGIVFGPDPVPADFATRGGGLVSLRPSHFEATATDLAAVNDDLPGIMERYPSLRVPVAILYGRGDRILDYRAQGERFAAIVAQAKLTLVEGGHMPLVIAADLTADWLAAFAATVMRPAAGAPTEGRSAPAA